MDKLWIGAAYYPEMWDEAEVEKDVVRCKELGLNVLRMGEFAWGKMEPREGEFDFAWLKRAVDIMYENGIMTVMCTPTCTPPRWMLNRYEEMRQVTSRLQRANVSSRCHPCKTSPIMREKNRIIVTEMAKVFADHPGVIGWQIDNELFPYGEGCYCPLCRQAFRDYLKRRYGTTDNLNRAWGMTRWSLEYESFDAVEPPFYHEWRHPSLVTEWHKFQCEQIYSYVDEQAEILHAFGCRNVGTDMMQMDLLDYYKMNRKLDRVQFNHYNPAAELPMTSFSYDFLRCVLDRPFWVTETQAGWNGSHFAEFGDRPVGNCYANTWLPIARGGEMNMYWLFRSHPNGHELAHGALYNTAGRAYRVSNEVKRAAEEFSRAEEFLAESRVESKVALTYSATAAVNFMSAPLVKGFDYRENLVKKFYLALRHYNVDVIDTPHALDGYRVLITPFATTLDENGFVSRVKAWVEQGGTWIVGPMSDVMDENTSKYTRAPFSFLEEFAGVYTKYQKPIDSDLKARWKDGSACAISTYYDAFECLPGTESLADYDGGECDGLSVVTRRSVGKGCVILLGSVPSHRDLLRLVDLAPIAEADENITLTERSGAHSGIIAVETEGRAGTLTLSGTWQDLITERRLSGTVAMNAYEVLVLVRAAE